MDLQQYWVMQKFNIGTAGYFLYCDGDRFSDYSFLNQKEATMKFKTEFASLRSRF